MRKINILLSIAFLLCLVSCATTIRTKVLRPAELDLNGANSVAVLPFRTNSWNSEAYNFLDFLFSPVYESIDKRLICESLTECLTLSLINSQYMQVVSSTAVQAALKSGQTPPCDVYLTGYIQYYDEKIDVRRYKTENKHSPNPVLEPGLPDDPNSSPLNSNPKPRNGSEYVIDPEPDGLKLGQKPNPLSAPKEEKFRITYSKSVDATIVYEIIDARTNRIISHRARYAFGYSGEYHRKSDLPSGYSLLQCDIKSIVSEIQRKIQPYPVYVSFRLLGDKTKDSQIQQAHEMAKYDSLEDAKDNFLAAYERTGNFESAYNAAQILGVLRRYDEAEKILSELYQKTGDRRAGDALLSIRQEILYAQKLQAQENAMQN